VTCLLKQTNELMAQLTLSVDDKDTSHIRLTYKWLHRSRTVTDTVC
jgi:hypothetical protein